MKRGNVKLQVTSMKKLGCHIRQRLIADNPAIEKAAVIGKRGIQNAHVTHTNKHPRTLEGRISVHSRGAKYFVYNHRRYHHRNM